VEVLAADGDRPEGPLAGVVFDTEELGIGVPGEGSMTSRLAKKSRT
jgi:hypothetical protein